VEPVDSKTTCVHKSHLHPLHARTAHQRHRLKCQSVQVTATKKNCPLFPSCCETPSPGILCPY
jgi:hypothetical protein